VGNITFSKFGFCFLQKLGTTFKGQDFTVILQKCSYQVQSVPTFPSQYNTIKQHAVSSKEKSLFFVSYLRLAGL
jgi:hypothetical protein